jgi:lysophospholipase L1-like esterase
MKNENTHPIVDLPVKTILSFGPVGEILKKHIPSLRDKSTADALPAEVTFARAAEYFSLPGEAADALRKEMFAFLAQMEETNRREEAEFGVEVDPGDPVHIWSNTDEQIQEACVTAIEKKYAGRTGEIVFYGPSNIQMWYSLEEDMLPYRAQNHGMGGCVDVEMIRYAPRMLYPFRPAAVFFQTGSNDLATGFTLEQILQNKKEMYTLFLENMPGTKLVVMSGLPLPGRQEFWADTVKVNELLRGLCAETERMFFMDATDVMLSAEGPENMKTATGDGRYFTPAYFRMDQIHLNKKGHDVWTAKMKEILKEIL